MYNDMVIYRRNDTLKVESSTGITQSNNPTTWSVYTNPSRGDFTIYTDNPTIIELVDLTGKTLQEINVTDEKNIQVNLPKGVYFIREKNSNKSIKLSIE